MNLPVISLLALAVAVTLSCTTKINVGVLAMALAWIIGVYLAGRPFAEIAGGFPTTLFLTLVGVTLLFTQAKVNGTLDKVAHRAVRSCRGSLPLIPVMFFFLACVFGSIGPGSIASAALIGPMAMAVAAQTGIPAFLMAIMVANGANSSSLSPIGPTGIIVNGIMDKIGMPAVPWQNYLIVMAAHAIVAFSGYLIFGGWKFFRAANVKREVDVDQLAVVANAKVPNGDIPDADRPLQWRHWLTLAVIVFLVVGVIFFGINVGMGALAGAVILVLANATDEAQALRSMPWGPILMVSGVTVLIALIEKTGGIDLFSAILASVSTPESVTGVIALIGGTISVYSSTSGVVLPAFLPTVPGLVERLGGGDVLPVAWSLIVGSHLVDVSPLSTTGALCIAAAQNTDVRKLFRQMLAWGMSMAIVGAIGSYIVFGLLWG
jgi:Na+/H+ antiporter NhaD/arsenite permease-like protein